MQRILTSNYDPRLGFWRNIFLHQNLQDLPILPTLQCHIDRYINGSSFSFKLHIFGILVRQILLTFMQKYFVIIDFTRNNKICILLLLNALYNFFLLLQCKNSSAFSKRKVTTDEK